MKLSVVPAIIAGTQEELDQMLSKVIDYTDRIMLDIMDGVIVKTRSLNFDFKLPSGPEYEVHLMVENPLDYVNKLNEKVTRVILHAETVTKIDSAVRIVRKKGMEVYIALNPETNVSILKDVLYLIDGVLVMTVNPGRYGAKFIPDALDKVRKIRSWSNIIPIEVDGGMNQETAKMAIEAGATVIASGSYIMKSEDVEFAIKQLVDIMSP